MDKPTRYYSRRQEARIAKELGGKTVSNSGATVFHKGDVVAGEFLIEAKTKTTNARSIAIKKEWLDKQKKEAVSMRKAHWALAFNYGPDEEMYYVIDEQTFKYLKNMLEEK